MSVHASLLDVPTQTGILLPMPSSCTPSHDNDGFAAIPLIRLRPIDIQP